ncbi:hypothetical protein CL617_05340 [archaeon]|nr:hypothetical protein [archaeon]
MALDDEISMNYDVLLDRLKHIDEFIVEEEDFVYAFFRNYLVNFFEKYIPLENITPKSFVFVSYTTLGMVTVGLSRYDLDLVDGEMTSKDYCIKMLEKIPEVADAIDIEGSGFGEKVKANDEYLIIVNR